MNTGPIAVFDAGIGSYAIVEKIRKALPLQDVLYLADRANFPYGARNRDELLATMRRTISYLQQYDPSGIVIASNAPSIMVLEQLKTELTVPLFGVFPPLTKAIEVSHSGQVGIMGVDSLIRSQELASFVQQQAAKPQAVQLIPASSMVQLVESGAFLTDPQGTQLAVTDFIHKATNPGCDVLTLSSTHLPWLRDFFEAAAPHITFLDPADQIVADLKEQWAPTLGKHAPQAHTELRSATPGKLRTLVTEKEGFSAQEFSQMLNVLGVHLELEVVSGTI